MKGSQGMIGIIGAMADEVNGLKFVMSNVLIETVSSVDFFLGKLCGINVVVAESGVGKVNAAVAAQTMILKYNTDYVIFIGVAGGLHDALKIGDVVIASSVVEHDMDTTPLGDPPGYITGLDRVYIDCDARLADILERCARETGLNTLRGTIASGDQFIADDDTRNRLKNMFNAYAAEMEGASVGHVCAMNGVKFAVLRTISDTADSSSHIDFPTFCKMAAENAIKVIKASITQI